MMVIRAVYFDAVGTLIYPEPPAEEVYASAGRRYGQMETPAEIRRRMWQAFRTEEEWDRLQGWRVDEHREAKRWRRIVRACFPHISTERFELLFAELYEHFAQPWAWRVVEEAEAVLAALQSRGLIVGVASNYDARLRRVLAGLEELAAVRQRVVLSAEVGYRKPAAAFFAAVVAQATCSANEMLYVGDDPANDYAGARAAGLQAVLYRPAGDQPNADFGLRWDDAVIRSGSTSVEEPITLARLQRLPALLTLTT